jgi:biopolymer transport protein ExbD
MKIDTQTARKPRIEMLPLIDIVFLLLVFFIYAMLSMAVHRGLPVELPTSTTAEIDKHLVLSVSVKSDGTIYVDKEEVPLETLSETLKRKAQSGKEPGVLLFGDRNLPYQRLFRVLD